MLRTALETRVHSVNMRLHRSALLLSCAVLLLTTYLGSARAEVEDATEDEYEDVSRAHLVLRKSIKGGEGSDLQVAGRNVTIVLDIFNAGSA